MAVVQRAAKVKFRDFRRGLCLLDPYGLHLDWKVISEIGQDKAIEIFLNFPIADMNRNVFWRNYTKVDAADITRMNRFWGDETWKDVKLKKTKNLFGEDDEMQQGSEELAKAFQERLKKVAGFGFVPEPMPMRNTNGAIVYYLYFASPNSNGSKIAKSILTKYKNVGAK